MGLSFENNTRSAGWASIASGLVWIILWNLAGEASRQDSPLAGGVWRLLLSLPLVFLLAAQLGQRSRFGLASTPVTIGGFWIVFYSTAGLLVGNLLQFGIERLPWRQMSETATTPQLGVVVMGLALTVHPIGLTLLGSTPGQGFSELTRGTLLAFGIGLLAVLTAGLFMSMLLNPSTWVLSAAVFMFGGGWAIVGLTLIQERAPKAV